MTKFHGCQFRSPVMSPFFCTHESYEDITLDDVQPSFHPLMYPIDGDSDSNICLTMTYSVEFDLSEPTFPFVIQLTSNSSSSTASQAPTLRT